MNRFNWQAGTLVSKAKVTINGIVYEVEPAEYEGTTPLSPENLNEMQEILFQAIYPVGSIYMSTVGTDPATLFGFGTWELWGKGKVPVGIDTEDTDFNTVEKTGGEKTHTHSLENGYAKVDISENNRPYWKEKSVTSYSVDKEGTDGNINKNNSSTLVNKAVELGGNTDSESNLQPYITCYMWKRTT